MLLDSSQSEEFPDGIDHRINMNRVFSIIVILFCFEIGLFLIVAPWSTLWENNLLFLYAPSLRPVFLANITRMTVSSLGILDFLIGFSELFRFFGRSSISWTKST